MDFELKFLVDRPAWNLAGEVVDGGAERWQHISANRASNEKLIVLLNDKGRINKQVSR